MGIKSNSKECAAAAISISDTKERLDIDFHAGALML
jgi:hypothetical protein